MLPMRSSVSGVVVTMSTVGYGDLYPTSGGGKTVAALCILSGLVMVHAHDLSHVRIAASPACGPTSLSLM